VKIEENVYCLGNGIGFAFIVCVEELKESSHNKKLAKVKKGEKNVRNEKVLR